ncbi:MAG: hypothetical protein A2Y33_09205 [Spirochaetes bacterium GWF1_51_8]|nr:MAG: hypothetical protein A2Y33_09205 [Spirochaetes bacterium GWF1_51_8]
MIMRLLSKVFGKKSKTRVEIARDAYERKDMKLHKTAHELQAIGNEPWHKTGAGRYIGSAVYGASDGIVTTFAVVAGVAGASLSPGVVLILGFANLFADGFSMAVGDYLSSKSEKDYFKSERDREAWEVEVTPEGETAEIREIYRRKGLEGEQLDKMVEIVTANKELWIETMMHEELGMMEDGETSPIKSSIVTFLSFVIAGFMPLAAYVFASYIPVFRQNLFLSASVITGATLFAVGALRQRITAVKWYLGGLEMLLVGGLSAAVAYFVGFLLKTIFGISV